MIKQKPKVAFYWCASCGGCEETVVDLNAAILDVADAVDIVLWPVALDFKYHHIEALKDGDIAVSFINGAIRTNEQAHISKLLRQKSGLVVAFGSCAHTGGIPGLANLTSREEIFRTSFHESPTVVNASGTVPQEDSLADGMPVRLPAFWEEVHTLDQWIDVDYYIPGCPPPPALVLSAVTAILEGKLPEKGSVLAPAKALCDTCPRRKTKSENTKITKIHRPHEIIADPEICFLEQGIICCGPATRSGCGEVCINGNMPCTGCFGPPPGVIDQGAKLISAISSLFNAKTKEEAMEMARQVVDPAGTFHRYTVPSSLLGCRIHKKAAMPADGRMDREAA
ncbi:MAG: oxidoreductase [Candidatus Eisenbacteria bacterium]|uniref:Oxidoreductase n=1 Tax=Eiseniibacteriota bacterium TaxID=2212470 RepID=A0A948WBB4_UNCEI|nr:oxidoreductase [Candidatus Eisenbacteria bacterium]MBU1948190.1 oxidoreductase [Candidatus Eisenbacteria bacterium]MBU2689813.1 oxidoreductase [Candidatus Eisenbacteria bacterium]